MRTHLTCSSGLDGMPLTFDAFRECSVLGLVCLDKWVRLSSLHMIELWLELHTQTPGPDISERGIEVDKTKIEAIERIPYPRDIKGIRSFLGHAGFYRRFIKDFSKTLRPLTNILQKYVPLVFDEDCKEAFKVLTKILITCPIVQPPDWNLPF